MLGSFNKNMYYPMESAAISTVAAIVPLSALRCVGSAAFEADRGTSDKHVALAVICLIIQMSFTLETAHNCRGVTFSCVLSYSRIC